MSTNLRRHPVVSAEGAPCSLKPVLLAQQAAMKCSSIVCPALLLYLVEFGVASCTVVAVLVIYLLLQLHACYVHASAAVYHVSAQFALS